MTSRKCEVTAANEPPFSSAAVSKVVKAKSVSRSVLTTHRAGVLQAALGFGVVFHLYEQTAAAVAEALGARWQLHSGLLALNVQNNSFCDAVSVESLCVSCFVFYTTRLCLFWFLPVFRVASELPYTPATLGNRRWVLGIRTSNTYNRAMHVSRCCSRSQSCNDIRVVTFWGPRFP